VTLATMTSAATKSAIVETSHKSAPAQMVPAAASSAMEKVANTAEVIGQIAAQRAANTAMVKDANTANHLLANTATEKDANTANQIPANTAMVRDANTAKETNASAKNAAVKDADTLMNKAVVSSIAIIVVPLIVTVAVNIPLISPLKVARIAAPNLAVKVVQTMDIVPTTQKKETAESHHRKPTQELPSGARETKLAVMKNATVDSILEIDKAYDHY
jgi:hypothetical protein